MRWVSVLSLWGLYAQSALSQAYEALDKRLTVVAQRHIDAALQDKDSLVRAEAALLKGILAAQARTGEGRAFLLVSGL
jgi:hypothetical protein